MMGEQGPIEIVIHGCVRPLRPGIVAKIERLFREDAQLAGSFPEMTVRCLRLAGETRPSRERLDE